MGTVKSLAALAILAVVGLASALVASKFYAGRIRSLVEQRDAFETQLKQQTANVEAANAAIKSQNIKVREWQEAAERERIAREADRARTAEESRRLKERVDELLGRPIPADCCGALEAVYARQQEMIHVTQR